MDSEVLQRYSRQVLLEELGLEGQQKLLDAAVLVIGAGGLGCPALMYLAAAGIGRIGIADPDVIELSNLHRQVLYNGTELGQYKAEVAAAKLKLLNPQLSPEVFPFRIDRDNAAGIIGGYDLVLDGSDNFPTRYLVNDTCAALGIPLVFGSLSRFEGQLSVFNFRGGPDYRQLYPEPPADAEMNNCGDRGVIGTLPGIIGSYMASEAIKVCAGFGQVLSGKLMTVDVLSNAVRIFDFHTADVGSAEVAEVAKVSGTSKFSTPDLITKAELDLWKKDNEDFVLVDVREQYEYDEYNLGGLNIPLYELPGRMGEIPPADKIIFCCTAGYRGRIAARLLPDRPFRSLYLINI